MARAALLSVLVVGWLARDAMSEPIARQRVVLADLDPELRHAMEQALAPWHLEVVIEGAPPADTAMAQQRADADTARFVVWRDGDELVVYDRELEISERRDSRAGTLDPPTAAAAALTIKTMMRLPPPPPEPAPAVSSDAAIDPGFEVRLQAGIATRISRGTETGVSARYGGVVQLRPWADAGWRFGLAGDAGTATPIERAGFKGTWNEWALLATVSWSYRRGDWELEPQVAGGIRRSLLDGAEMMDVPRREHATLATARAGVWVRHRFAWMTLGAALAVDEVFNTPTYSKSNSPAEIFQAPGMGVELGAVVAVDL